MSKALVLNPLTGTITMGSGPGATFDRERADSHYLTVEARDERGRGSRNTVELVIRSGGEESEKGDRNLALFRHLP